MNKNRKSIPNKTRKQMEKEVKKGQSQLTPEEPRRTDSLTPSDALNKYPSKRQKVEKPLMDATVKEMEIKKKKLKEHKSSKRTTPGEVDHRESPPASIHPESTRWNKTLKLQNKTRGKALSKKIQKRNSKKH